MKGVFVACKLIIDIYACTKLLLSEYNNLYMCMNYVYFKNYINYMFHI